MKKYFPLILILILGTVLRFYHNTLISLWHDEAFSALLIKYPWQEMIYRIGLDVHPSMYYVFLRVWHYVFGDSLLSLRSMSIFFGVGAIWAGWAFTKEAFKNEKAALWAAVLIAINPFQITKFATEARMYTMGAFFALLSAYLLVKALNFNTLEYESQRLNMPNLPEATHARKKMWLYLLGFAVSMAIMIQIHYYLFFTAAAIGLYGVLYLVAHHRGGIKKFIPLLLSGALIAVSFLPWLKTFLYQYKQVQDGYWIPKMTAWSIPATFWDMLLGLNRDTSKEFTQWMLVVVTLFTAYLFYRFLKKTESFHKWLVALAVAAPFGGALLFLIIARLKGSNSSVFLDRYFIFASVFYSLALAVWLKEIKIKWLSVCLLVAYTAVNLYVFSHYWSELNVRSKPGMAAAAKYLQANVEPQHKLYVGTSFMFFNYKYYNQTPVKPLLFTGGTKFAKDISHFAGSAILTDEDLLPEFKPSVKTGDTVWLIWTNGFGSSKPETPGNWIKVDEKSYAEVRPYVGTYVYVTQYKIN